MKGAKSTGYRAIMPALNMPKDMVAQMPRCISKPNTAQYG
jgi:hypothetical protein